VRRPEENNDLAENWRYVSRTLQVYDETSIKALGNEFRSLSVLADQVEEQLTEDPNFPLRVPLSILVDYKGVRAFALALPSTSALL
jgi:hypothetical protein